MRLFLLLIEMFASLVLISCLSPSRSNSPYTLLNNEEDNLNKLIEEVDVDLRVQKKKDKDSDTTKDDQISDIVINSKKIPLELNERVQFWINYFAVKNPQTFKRYLQRGSKYQDLIVSILEEHSIPAEIYYLAMIESGFVLSAKSSVGATGFWQFMPATARGRYKMIVDEYTDERRDPIQSTKAAAQYLSGLYNVFNSWYLALAAYNGGESRIMNAILKYKTRNYWELVEKNLLPKETLNYVPKFLAAAIIGHNPEKFGFHIEKADPPVHLYRVKIPEKGVTLASVAKASKISLKELKDYNPSLLKNVTSPNRYEYIWLPQKAKEEFARNNYKLEKGSKLQFAQINQKNSKSKRFRSSSTTSKDKNYIFHTVKRNETLSSISSKYNVRIAYLKQINNMKDSNIVTGEVLKIPSYTSNAGRNQKLAKNSISTNIKYRVQAKDNLQSIAKRYNTTVSEIKKLNKLKSNNIKVGQILNLKKSSK